MKLRKLLTAFLIAPVVGVMLGFTAGCSDKADTSPATTNLPPPPMVTQKRAAGATAP